MRYSEETRIYASARCTTTRRVDSLSKLLQSLFICRGGKSTFFENVRDCHVSLSRANILSRHLTSLSLTLSFSLSVSFSSSLFLAEATNFSVIMHFS